ncbi:uncharacterized protein LOC127105222 [Lathyrus oleraceus]|uniref:uncharacterized protein LOC127105222 n=1 Tax=Pisum sativum TaxID=3888 RepID=UPI0021D1B6DC|nr:uncharacterized protein LOC127105222 [Pisum sativum]
MMQLQRFPDVSSLRIDCVLRSNRASGINKFSRFPELVNKCRIYDEESRVWSAHYKRLSEKRGKHLNRGNSYSVPVDKGKHIISYGRRPSVGGAPAPIKCYRCGGAGYRANECISDENKCFKCGKSGHLIVDCKINVPTYFNYGEPGHISTTFQKPKKAQTGGKVFALTGSQPNSYDMLIKGTCYIHKIPLIAIIDTGETHLVISANCV